MIYKKLLELSVKIINNPVTANRKPITSNTTKKIKRQFNKSIRLVIKLFN